MTFYASLLKLISQKHSFSFRTFAAAGFVVAPLSGAFADSCWIHNGSLMRLQAQGNERWLSYEQPRPKLRAAGVIQGTLLFNGTKTGNWYSGTARVFSKHCPGVPLEYHVSGPVRGDQLQVTVRGTRPVHRSCRPTGRVKTDTLVFTYSHQC